MIKILDYIDDINEYLGRVFKWTIIALCLVMCYEVAARYIFHAPTIWAFEVSTALYASVFMLCAAYALLYKAHVAIDIVYERFSIRGRAIFDIVSHIIFFYPFLITVFLHGIKFTAEAWKIAEKTESSFAMPVTPVKMMIPIFAGLLLLQGTAVFVRAIMSLVTGKLYYSKYKPEELPKCDTLPSNENVTAEGRNV